MLTFADVRRTAHTHYGEPFAIDRAENDVFSLVTPQRVRDEERCGLITVSGAWMFVDRETAVVDEWPHLKHLDPREAHPARASTPLTYSAHMAESWASSERARRTMVANRSKDTAPELAVRSLLHARGLRYRTNHRPEPTLRRTADIVFTRRRIAVFIDGCFWHGCPEHLAMPKSNVGYWTPKIERNRERDQETSDLLRAAGWTVLRFWEHEPPALVGDATAATVAEAQPITGRSQ